ncbi:diacylglycerol kinase family protein [Bacillus sp. FJAT-42376]|uniref:diacylglycerol kinase family protein n=1 Tax=Bacillus sp. FJAT-42376 TaxID=2014076 RepID=UPI000F512247|nr:diacylglycerol kinase family protein [Bacillus sp. FJAT-42376]AZB43667.1 diacylglycerol kinase family protein [Bacillus sp. FJAT-42376]
MGLRDQKTSELKRLLKSFAFAWAGIKDVYRRERNFQIHCFAMVLAAAAGFILQITVSEWYLIIGSIGAVLSLELMNTAIERTVDLAVSEYHPLAKAAKDAAAGAVFIAALAALILGLLIFVPKLINFI